MPLPPPGRSKLVYREEAYCGDLMSRVIRGFVYLVCVHFLVVGSCSDDVLSSSPIEMVLRSKLAVHGKVLRTFSDPRFLGNVVYTAEVQVYCIIKGPITERIINISDAGTVPGNCFSTFLQQSSTYIIIAEERHGRYHAMDHEITASPAHLHNVSTACRIDPKYPRGVVVGPTTVRCVTAAGPRNCIDERYYTTTTTTTTPPPTEYDYDEYTDEPDPEILPGEHSPNGISKSPPSVTSVSSLYGLLTRPVFFLPMFVLYLFVCNTLQADLIE